MTPKVFHYFVKNLRLATLGLPIVVFAQTSAPPFWYLLQSDSKLPESIASPILDHFLETQLPVKIMYVDSITIGDQKCVEKTLLKTTDEGPVCEIQILNSQASRTLALVAHGMVHCIQQQNAVLSERDPLTKVKKELPARLLENIIENPYVDLTKSLSLFIQTRLSQEVSMHGQNFDQAPWNRLIQQISSLTQQQDLIGFVFSFLGKLQTTPLTRFYLYQKLQIEAGHPFLRMYELQHMLNTQVVPVRAYLQLLRDNDVRDMFSEVELDQLQKSVAEPSSLGQMMKSVSALLVYDLLQKEQSWALGNPIQAKIELSDMIRSGFAHLRSKSSVDSPDYITQNEEDALIQLITPYARVIP